MTGPSIFDRAVTVLAAVLMAAAVGVFLVGFAIAFLALPNLRLKATNASAITAGGLAGFVKP